MRKTNIINSKSVLFLFLFFAFLSCQNLFYNYYEIKSLTSFDEQKYTSFLSSLDTSVFQFSSIISSSKQFGGVHALSEDSAQIKHLFQPLQILYFENEKLISFHVNCHAQPKGRTLNWNFANQFDAFPPHSTIDKQYLTLTLNQYEQIYPEIKPQKTYTVLIFWTSMMEKMSKDMIKTVKTNIFEHNKQDSISVVLINTDYFYIENLTL